MSTQNSAIQHFIGIGNNAAGEAVPLFATFDDGLTALDHHAAVVSAARQGPILPAIFGSQLGINSELLAAKITQRNMALRHAVDASAGLIEMGVRITWIGSGDDKCKDARSGRGFLQAVAKKARAEAAFVDTLALVQNTFSTFAGVSAVQLLGVQERVARIALSVERHQALKIAIKIEEFASTEIEIDVSGPWPLYSFGADYVLGNEVLP
jgi:Gas vesicle synthesis protein GvpL/GvpF